VILPAPPEVHGLTLRLEPLLCDGAELARFKGFLSAHELERGNRLIDPVKRERFFVGRGRLREALAELLGGDPKRIELLAGEHGKLRLAGLDEHGKLRFNLTHAGHYLLMAFTAGHEVGIDLEQVRDDLAFAAMAQRYFSLREREDLFSLQPQEQLHAFYRCWTRKEAYLKGTGSGFSQPSDTFDVSLLPDQPAALLAHRTSPAEVGAWEIRDVGAVEGYWGAVAFRITKNFV